MTKITNPRYAWPEDLAERGATWIDYYKRGKRGDCWCDSVLWAGDGTLLAELRRGRKYVIWNTVFGAKGKAPTRRDAKREARISCRRFLAKKFLTESVSVVECLYAGNKASEVHRPRATLV